MPPADTALPAEPGTVPNVVGKDMRQAVEDLIRAGLIPTVKGDGGTVGKQNPAPGTKIDQTGSEATSCTLWLTEQ